jgi:hypothetical protein
MSVKLLEIVFEMVCDSRLICGQIYADQIKADNRLT